MTSTFNDRMAFLLDRFGGPKLSQDTGISRTQLHRLKDAGRETTRENLLKIAQSAGVSVMWLMTGEGSMSEDGSSSDFVPQSPQSAQSENNQQEYVQIPLLDLHISADDGAVIAQEQVVDALAFKRDWVSNTLGATREDLYLINVQGESMTPTLHPGDVILVDRRNANNVTTDGIYVLRMGDSLLVKRIQRLPGQILRITSDNPTYSPFEIKLEDAANDDMAIVGRVVWSGRRM